jgi:hypothetical protein
MRTILAGGALDKIPGKCAVKTMVLDCFMASLVLQAYSGNIGGEEEN